MTITDRDLLDEITQLVDDGVNAGLTMDADWITGEMVDRRHSDTGFLKLCATRHIRDLVRECLREYKDAPAAAGPQNQLTLPGFEFLQKAYLIERNKQQVIVPLALCTEEELKRKEDLYRSMSAGCMKHANELERYRVTHFGK